MRKVSLRKAELQALECFFKEYSEKNGSQKMVWFFTGFCIFILGIWMALPYQLWGEEELNWALLSCGFSVSVAVTYLVPYLVRQGQIVGDRGFGKVLRFMPVSKWDLFFFRVKKLATFMGKVYVALQILQLFFSIVCLQQVFLENVLYPFLIVFLVPVLMGMLFVLIRK